MDKSASQVLLVDDDPVMLRLTRAMLESGGYTTRLATTGQEALAVIQEDCPHYLLTDWMMPGLTGPELCRAVRQMDLPHYLYILMLTAKTGSNFLVEGLDAGADDFLTKPVKQGELLARMKAGARVLTLEQRLNQLVRSDPLTGIYNRRAFHDQAQREFQRVRRYKGKLSVVMVDIDYFKRINDTYGHPAGDLVIKQVAKVLQSSLRSTDYVCRFGGEEFCAILTETREEDAAIWADRVRMALSRLEIPVGKETIKITASMGVAGVLDDTKDIDTLIDAGDQALLVAKQSGRDRVVCYRALCEAGNFLAPPENDMFQGQTARNMMTALVACLREDETVGQAADFFLRFRVNSCPVVGKSEKLAGILSEKDVLTTITSPDSWSRPVSEIMKRNVVCFDEDTPASVIFDFLCRVSIRRVIVVRDGFPTGVIGRGSFLRWYNNLLHARGELPRPNGVTDSAKKDRALSPLARALWTEAEVLKDTLDHKSHEVLPLVIDRTSRMQELINDILSSVSNSPAGSQVTGAAAF